MSSNCVLTTRGDCTYFVHICRIEVGLLGDDDRANLLRLKMKGTPMSREVTIKRLQMCGHIELIRVGETRSVCL